MRIERDMGGDRDANRYNSPLTACGKVATTMGSAFFGDVTSAPSNLLHVRVARDFLPEADCSMCFSMLPRAVTNAPAVTIGAITKSQVVRFLDIK